MKLNVAINGFGRIGRMLIRAFLTKPHAFDGINIVAINDVADAQTLLHLLMFDSTHGRLADLGVMACIDDGRLLLQKDEQRWVIPLLQHADPATLNWQALGVELVLECTGHFRSYAQANLHRLAGAKQVIIGSAPFDMVDASIVMGVNDHLLNRQLNIISGVSCTTQALVPLLHTLDNTFGLNSVMLTEIHAVTADQTVLDQAHRDLRRARASGHNIIPTTSSSIHASQLVLPQLTGKLCGYSIRVPTINVACIDVTVTLHQKTSVSTIKDTLKHACSHALKGIMAYNELPLVSSDFVGDGHSLVIDDNQLMQAGEQVKLFAWFDNEVGYAHRLLEMCQKIALS